MNSPLALDAHSQRLLDKALAAMARSEAGRPSPVPKQLGEWLNEEGRLVDGISEQANWIHAPDLDLVVDKAWESFDGIETHEAILAHLRSTVVSALAGEEDFWGLEYSVDIAVPVRSSRGDQAVLAFRFHHFDDPVEWHGMFRDTAAFVDWLESRGQIAWLATFEQLPRDRLLCKWGQRFL